MRFLPLAGRNRRILLRPRWRRSGGAAGGGAGGGTPPPAREVDAVADALQRQVQSAQPDALRLQLTRKYDLLIERIDPVPLSITVLPSSPDKVREAPPGGARRTRHAFRACADSSIQSASRAASLCSQAR